MGYGVDLGLVERHDDALHYLRVDVELLQCLLDRAAGLAGIDEIAFYDCIFLMHLYYYELCIVNCGFILTATRHHQNSTLTTQY